MITWNDFILFALPALALWGTGAAVAIRRKGMSRLAFGLVAGGLTVFAAFIALLWISLQRPPLRTLGETRLWYSLFLMLCGALTYYRWHYRWVLALATVVTTVFVVMNIVKPELHDTALMPALQSYWFVPHVTVYMFAYAVFGCALILALAGWFGHTDEYLPTQDRLTCVGLAFLTFGMLSGALWAKEAWGFYWSWDPKETWAAVTWSVYLLYLHLRLGGRIRRGTALALLAVGFLCLQMCWYGVNYLPAAQSSLHVYSN